ncbi:MAG: MBOAT family O-acyltransferase [Anaerolineales bacterium]
MTILQLGIFALTAVGIGRLKQGRELALLATSIFIIYWLQPAQQFISLVFWLPTATLTLTIFIWVLIAKPEIRSWQRNWSSVAVILAVLLLVDFNQFFGFDQVYMTTTPRVWMILVFVSLYGAFLFGTSSISSIRKFLIGASFIGILLVFVYLKTPLLIEKSFNLLHSLRGVQSPDQLIPFTWLGYSYIAFRLMHTVRDHQSGRLPDLTLGEYVNYVIFFPTFTAGPIDRAERFVRELREPVALADQDWLEAGKRFFVGLFKKFVIADSLALIAINEMLVKQVHSAGWMWFFLYMYSLRIYFDFSGYTDVAIGLARVIGIRLPENFAAPYLKPNLTQFWNSWHMTLTQWFRAYYFNPITRALRAKDISVPLIVFVTQITTMVLIGLWHGVAWTFVLWGLWHGLGLFIQNRWSEWVRTKMKTPLPTQGQLLLNAIGIFLTFNFVSLGWLFFTLPTTDLAWQAMLKLFGFNL